MTAHVLPDDVRAALDAAARTPRLLVASDYDGTMAPFVDDPSKASPDPRSVQALRALSGLRDTTAAVISGRALADLVVLAGMPAEVHLVGSHGSEFDHGFVHEIGDEQRELLDRVVAEMTHIASDHPGTTVETKPASAALHVRTVADRDDARTALDRVRAGLGAHEDVQVTEGKNVIELAIIATDKGGALDTLRHQSHATTVVFFGDDVTDEKAFLRLAGPDVGVKVGQGETAAALRIADTHDVAVALTHLFEQRRSWLAEA